MQLPIFEKYIDELIEKSTLDVPAWNIEKAREGKAAGWNYIDGCMILALLEIYNATGEKKYYEFADAFIDHRVQEDGTILMHLLTTECRKTVPSPSIPWKNIILTMSMRARLCSHCMP